MCKQLSHTCKKKSNYHKCKNNKFNKVDIIKGDIVMKYS